MWIQRKNLLFAVWSSLVGVSLLSMFLVFKSRFDVPVNSSPLYRKDGLIICTAITEADAIYFPEWIEFHLTQGVTHVFAYSLLNDNFEDSIFEPYLRENVLTIKPLAEINRSVIANCQKDMSQCKALAMKDCLRGALSSSRWSVALDISDYLFSKSSTVLEELVATSLTDCARVPIFFFGTAGHRHPVADNVPFPLIIPTHLQRANSALDHSTTSGILRDICSNSASSSNHLTNPSLPTIRINRYHVKTQTESKQAYPSWSEKDEAAFNAETDDTILQSYQKTESKLRERYLRGSWKNTDFSKYSPLFAVHPVAKDMVATPQICVAFLSCRRVDLLRRTMWSFIAYMQLYEPKVSYELVVLDNGSTAFEKRVIANELPVDKFVSIRRNLGIGAALNTLFFGACNSSYILSLEEDWSARFESWPMNLPALQMSMSILEENEDILEVWLRDENDWKGLGNRTNWLTTQIKISENRSQKVQFRKQYSLGSEWGVYTNGASLKSTKALQKIGLFNGVNGEPKYAQRAVDAGFASAHICTEPDQSCPEGWSSFGKWGYKGLFEHIGTSGRSPGHADIEVAIHGKGDIF